MELGDAVILDADANKVTTEYDDLQTLPEEVVSCPLCIGTCITTTGKAVRMFI